MALQRSGLKSSPAGVESNLVDPTSPVPYAIPVHTICISVTTLLMAFRLYHRVAIHEMKLGTDDCEFASFVCRPLGCNFIGRRQPVAKLPLIDAPDLFVVAWVLSVTSSALLIMCTSLFILNIVVLGAHMQLVGRD